MINIYNINKTSDCLSCGGAFSLPAGELFDDGSVADYDRLVCMEHKRIVGDNDCCDQHTTILANIK